MTATLPPEVRGVFERFITTEYTTVGARRQPITWPVTPYYEPGGETIDVTTGLGYPKKADDARRHPSVSLLFSDPTGSGLERPPHVLVQGTAIVDEENLEANRERYFRESWRKLPGTRSMHPPAFVRGLLDWYYTRIYVKVRPERVFVWAGGDIRSEPEIHDAHLEEVRSGHSEEPPEPHGSAPPPDRQPWDARMSKLANESTAVIGWLGPDGFPLAARLPIEPDPDSREIRLPADPAGIPLLEGRACLTAHRHTPDFSSQWNFQVRGELVSDPEGWRLVPRRLVGGMEVPESRLGRSRVFVSRTIAHRRTAKERLRARDRATRS